MTNKELKKLQDTTENIEYSTEDNCKLTRKLIRRVEELTSQQCLTNNILILCRIPQKSPTLHKKQSIKGTSKDRHRCFQKV